MTLELEEVYEKDMIVKNCYDKAVKRKLICPECQTELTLFETWNSLLGISLWYRYGCETCGCMVEVKRAK